MFVLKLVAPKCVHNASALGVTSQKHKRFVSVGLCLEREKETLLSPRRVMRARRRSPSVRWLCVRVTSLYVGTVRRDVDMPTSLTSRTTVKVMHWTLFRRVAVELHLPFCSGINEFSCWVCRALIGDLEVVSPVAFMAGPIIAPVKPDVLGTSLKGNNTEGENCVFWVITQRVVTTPNRRFGTTYRSHLQGYPWPLKIGPDRVSRDVGKEL